MLIVKTKGGRTPTIKLVVIFNPTPKLLVLGRVRAAVIGSPHHHRHGHAQRHHQHHHQQHCRNSAPTAHLQASSSAPTAHPPYPPTPHSFKSKLLKTTAEWTCKFFNRKKKSRCGNLKKKSLRAASGQFGDDNFLHLKGCPTGTQALPVDTMIP